MIVDIVSEIAANLEAMFAAAEDEVEVAVWPLMLFNPSTTAIDIFPAPTFRSRDAAGMGDISGAYEFIVRARTGLNDLESGQWLLYAFLDDDSDLCVAHAVEDDPTLNGYSQDVYVGEPTGFEAERAPGHEDKFLVKVSWPVTVVPAHS